MALQCGFPPYTHVINTGPHKSWCAVPSPLGFWWNDEARSREALRKYPLVTNPAIENPLLLRLLYCLLNVPLPCLIFFRRYTNNVPSWGHDSLWANAAGEPHAGRWHQQLARFIQVSHSRFEAILVKNWQRGPMGGGCCQSSHIILSFFAQILHIVCLWTLIQWILSQPKHIP